MSSLYDEKEILEEVNLCDEYGNLNPKAIGWSKIPLHNCNLSSHRLRKKRWNYWCITNHSHLFSVTLSNVDYMGLPFVYFLDFESNQFIEKTILSPLGIGCALGNKVEDDATFEGKDMFISLQNQNEGVHIKVIINDFGGENLDADFLVNIPKNHETLNVVIPWSKKQFQFTSKQNTLPTKGTLNLGKKTMRFEPTSAFACLDFGRGVWPFSSFWNWSSFSTRLLDGRTVGLNLGAGWTDGTGLNENGLCIDGHLIKLHEDVNFSYNPQKLNDPWKLSTTFSDSVDLTFHPFFERVAKTDAFIIKSEAHQMIGKFEGYIKSDEGEVIKIKDAVGWAEEHHAKW
jgi:hypothetical protein